MVGEASALAHLGADACRRDERRAPRIAGGRAEIRRSRRPTPNAINTKDATKRAETLEIFSPGIPTARCASTPMSRHMAALQTAGNPAKADATATRAAADRSRHMRALANRAYVGRTRAMSASPAPWRRPSLRPGGTGSRQPCQMAQTGHAQRQRFRRTKAQMIAIFDGVSASRHCRPRTMPRPALYLSGGGQRRSRTTWPMSISFGGAAGDCSVVRSARLLYGARAIAIARAPRTIRRQAASTGTCARAITATTAAKRAGTRW